MGVVSGQGREIRGERERKKATLTPGLCEAIAPGRCEHGIPTPGSAYTRLHGDHTPRDIGSHGSQGTGSKPS